MSIVKYKGYQGSVAYEDGHLVVTILHIADMISTQCNAASEVQAVFADLVEDYLETCKAVGKSPEKPLSGTFNVRIGSELHKAAVQAATRLGLSLNAWIGAAIREQSETSRPVEQIHREQIAQLHSLKRQRVVAWRDTRQPVYVAEIEHLFSSEGTKTSVEEAVTSGKFGALHELEPTRWKN